MNFLEGQVQRANGQSVVKIGEFSLTPQPAMQPILSTYDGRTVLVGIRAENMETLSSPAADALKASVLVVEPLGAQNLLTVRLGEDQMKVATHPTFETRPDADIWLRFPADKIRWIDRDTRQALYPNDTEA
jgi:multiple sugar transport system ATP-binding protein